MAIDQPRRCDRSNARKTGIPIGGIADHCQIIGDELRRDAKLRSHRLSVPNLSRLSIDLHDAVAAHALAEVVADAEFFDYQWSLELAQGDTCSPLPASHLPPAQCIMSPCAD